MARLLPTRLKRRVLAAAMVALMVIATVASRSRVFPRQPLGYRAVMSQLAAANQLAGRRLLVVSDEVGEGAAVTEAAVLHLLPAPTIIRGSKLLGTDDWVGRHFVMTFTSSLSLMQGLEDFTPTTSCSTCPASRPVCPTSIRFMR